MKILVDTNVIIDILCKREPFFEDAVVSAIAERQKAKYILTRNTKDFEKSKILSITPHDYLNIKK